MRSVVVTGGGTGIGRAVAAAFINAGNEVVVTGRRSAPLAAVATEPRQAPVTSPGRLFT